MRLSRYVIEQRVPLKRAAPGGGHPEEAATDGGSLPQIRRHIERICEKLGLRYEDICELHMSYGSILAVYYDRDEEGKLYRDDMNRVVTKQKRMPVDTFSFIGDEEDI